MNKKGKNTNNSFSQNLLWVITFIIVITPFVFFCIFIYKISLIYNLIIAASLYILMITILQIRIEKIKNESELYQINKEIFFSIDSSSTIKNKKKIKENIEFLKKCADYYKQLYENNEISKEEIYDMHLEEITLKKSDLRIKDNSDGKKNELTDKIINKIKTTFDFHLYEEFMVSILSGTAINKRDFFDYAMPLAISLLSTAITITQIVEQIEFKQDIYVCIVIYVILLIGYYILVSVCVRKSIKKNNKQIIDIIDFLNRKDIKNNGK